MLIVFCSFKSGPGAFARFEASGPDFQKIRILTKGNVVIDFTRTFETDRIFLRPIEAEDAEGFFDMTGDKALWIYFTSDLSGRERLLQWVTAAIEDTRNEKRLALAIVNKADCRLMGSTSLGNFSARDKRVEIGWTWIGRGFQGTGINDEVKYLLLAYCFDELAFERVEFKTDVLNLPARNALRRIGATEEGILRSHTLMTHNRRRDTIYYSILRKEWERIKAELVL